MKKTKNKKPNCYNCKWRGDVPGSAHSQCLHPKNKKDLENPLMAMMGIMAGVQRVPPAKGGELKVKGDPHGIRNGWFNFPFNFDPVWLEECDGYEKKR